MSNTPPSFPDKEQGEMEIKNLGDAVEVGSFIGGSFPEPLASGLPEGNCIEYLVWRFLWIKTYEQHPGG